MAKPALLRLLIDIAREAAAGTWQPTAHQNFVEGPVTVNMRSWVTTDRCGTTACIIGHGLLDERTADQLVSPMVDPLRVTPREQYNHTMLHELLGSYAHHITPLTFSDLADGLEFHLFMPQTYDVTDGLEPLHEFIKRAEHILTLEPNELVNFLERMYAAESQYFLGED